MGNIEEKKYLQFIIKKLDSNKKHPIATFWAAIILWVLLVLIIMGASILNKLGIINVGVLLVITAIVSGLVGCILMMRYSEKYWPYMKNHIDKNSILERINELEV